MAGIKHTSAIHTYMRAHGNTHIHLNKTYIKGIYIGRVNDMALYTQGRSNTKRQAGRQHMHQSTKSGNICWFGGGQTGTHAYRIPTRNASRQRQTHTHAYMHTNTQRYIMGAYMHIYIHPRIQATYTHAYNSDTHIWAYRHNYTQRQCIHTYTSVQTHINIVYKQGVNAAIHT